MCRCNGGGLFCDDMIGAADLYREGIEDVCAAVVVREAPVVEVCTSTERVTTVADGVKLTAGVDDRDLTGTLLCKGDNCLDRELRSLLQFACVEVSLPILSVRRR